MIIIDEKSPDLKMLAIIVWASLIGIVLVIFFIKSDELPTNTSENSVNIGNKLYTSDNFFIELVENKADITGGYAIFKLHNPTSINIPINKDSLNFDLGFNNTEIKSKEILILKDVYHSDNITDFRSNCMPYNETDENMTTYLVDNCTDVIVGWHWNNYTTKDYVSIENSILKAGDTASIKIVASWKAKIGGINIDWIPKLSLSDASLSKNNWAWWNATWTNKTLVAFNNTGGENETNFILHLQLNLTALNISTCDQMRFLSNDETVSFPYKRENCGAVNAITYVHFVIDSCNTTVNGCNFYIYSGNTSVVTDTNNMTNFANGVANLLYFYTFDENTGNNIIDSHGSLNATSNVSWNGWMPGFSAFGVTSQQPNCTNFVNTTDINTAQNMTYVGWTNITATVSNKHSWGDDRTSSNGWYEIPNHAVCGVGKLLVGGDDDGAYDLCSGLFPTNQWIFQTVSIGKFSVNTTIQIYINGTISGAKTATKAMKNVAVAFRFGKGYGCGATQNTYMQDDFFMFNTNLTAAYIKNMYDAYNVSNYLITATQSSSPANTCTYSSGTWSINCADNCVITTNTNMNGNAIIFYGTGSAYLNANIQNFSNRTFVPNCPVVIGSGKVFG